MTRSKEAGFCEEMTDCLSFLLFYDNKSSRLGGVFDDFSYFLSLPYVVTPHLHRLIETVHMFLYRINKNYL